MSIQSSDVIETLEQWEVIMHAWEQIQITVEHIENHLAEEIKINELAKLASLSSFYYQRLFSRLVKKTVNEYIKLRRLARASETLLDKSIRILDIALSFGFKSHETFTRAFKSAYGMTPESYRNNPVILNNFNKPQLLLNYTLVDENVPLIVDEIVLEIRREILNSDEYFVGMTVEEPINQIPGGDETGIDGLAKLWDDFHSKSPGISTVRANSDELGVAYMGTKEGYYRYFAGAQAISNDVPDGYDLWELSKGNYVVCMFEAEDFKHLVTDAIYKAQGYLFNTWLPNHELSVLPFCAERYKTHSPETSSMEIWVKTEEL